MSITTSPVASDNPYINGLTTEPGQVTPVIFTPGSTIKFFFDTDARTWFEAEKSAARMAWDSWEAVVNLNIEETMQRDEATVLMQISILPKETLAVATAPNDGQVPSTNKINVVGDALKNLSAGGDSYLTFVHEIGHNLGLYHPHSTSVFPGVPDGGQGVLGHHNMNQNIWTVMSYNTGFNLEPVNNPAFGNAIGPMTLDIAAAQFAYGAKAANTGNNTYLLPSQNIIGTGWKAIWDTGGIDTLSAAGNSLNVTIDLREAPLVRTEGTGYVSWAPGIKGGYSIANGSVIENAIGGAGSDSLIGNDADNIFVGGGGDDSIMGGGGIDTVSIGTVRACATVKLENTGAIHITDRNTTEGTDKAFEIETIQFTDGNIDLVQLTNAINLSASQFTDLAKVYVAYFNRAADAEGLFFWADKLAEGMDMATIASFFFQSEETKNLYPGTEDISTFVTQVYANVLGRASDAAGFDFWTTNLTEGSLQPANFVLSIIGGAQGADIDYLSDKADLGVYFSAIKGMSDVADALDVMNIFGDQATSNKIGAKDAAEGHYADAIAVNGGDFLLKLAGVVNDPFFIA